MQVIDRPQTSRGSVKEFFRNDPTLRHYWPLHDNLLDVVGAGLQTDILQGHGGFSIDNDPYFSIQSPWQIQNGKAIRDIAGGQSGIFVNSSITNGKSYKVTYTIDSISAGSVWVIIGLTDTTHRVAAGTYTEIVVCGAGTQINLAAANNTICVVSNLTVTEEDGRAHDLLCGHGEFNVDADPFWTIGANWTILGGTANCNSAAATDSVSVLILTIGRKYRIVYTVSNYVSGSVRVLAGNTTGTTRTSNGTYTEELVCTAQTRFFVQNVGATQLSVDNVYIYEVLEGHGNHLIAADTLQGHGNFSIDADPFYLIGVGWTITGGIANYNGNTITDYLRVLAGGITGKAYSITFTITRIASGGIQLLCGGNVGTIRTAVGTYTETIVFLANTIFAFRGNGAATDVDIDNVTIREVYSGDFRQGACYFNGLSNCLQTTDPVYLSDTGKVTVLCNLIVNGQLLAGTIAMYYEMSLNGASKGFSLYQNASVANDPLISIGATNNPSIMYYNYPNEVITTIKKFLTQTFDTSLSTREVKLYKDAVLLTPIVNNDGNNSLNLGADTFYIGSRGGTLYFSNITISDIAIFSRILSQREMYDYYMWSNNLNNKGMLTQMDY